ncbi:MAG: hypothetical protein IPI60_15585 [Saprospiraceae bacterium]|nr:hypothetical protein [Saprospiraceae bacterium]
MRQLQLFWINIGGTSEIVSKIKAPLLPLPVPQYLPAYHLQESQNQLMMIHPLNESISRQANGVSMAVYAVSSSGQAQYTIITRYK